MVHLKSKGSLIVLEKRVYATFTLSQVYAKSLSIVKYNELFSSLICKRTQITLSSQYRCFN